MATGSTQVSLSSPSSVSASSRALKQRRCTVSYASGRDAPAVHLSGNWLRTVGFDIGKGVTVKVADGCIVLIPDSDEVHALRNQLSQMKQAVQGIQAGIVGVLNNE